MPTSLSRIARLMAVVLVLAVGVLPGSASADDATTGIVRGHVLDAGAPAAGVTVAIMLSFLPATVAQGVTDGDGSFHIEVTPGVYKVRFDLPGGMVQFFPGRTDFGTADEIAVDVGLDAVIEESVRPHGAITGQVTTSSGDPASGALVGINGLEGIPISTTTVDRTGHYSFPFVVPRTVVMFVSATPSSAPRQWVHQHKTRADANPIVVTVGQTATVDEQLLPLGRISGQLTRAGEPLGGAGVQAISLLSPAESVSAGTRADGQFTMLVYPGSYKVKFGHVEILDQWAHGQESERLADVITVAAGGEVVLNEAVLPTGRISGHLTDSAGQPVPFAFVEVSDPTRARSFISVTNEEGFWFDTVRPGTYKVMFQSDTQVQWAFGQNSPNTANPVTVVADQETVVDDHLGVPGALTVTAVDARTGALRTDFCATATNDFQFVQSCTSTGTAEFATLGAGTYEVTASDGIFLDSVTPGVKVTSGHTTAVTARMRPGATLEVTVLDAATGAPVSSVCVEGAPADRAANPGEFTGGCPDETGKFTVDRLRPDKWVFNASSFDGVHGSQWVGPHGGVGSQAAAQVFTTKSGATTRVTVRLDGIGSVSGVITDKATGAPIEGAMVSAGSTGPVTAFTDADGHYTLDGLGPYNWVLFFGQDNYAGQWSGGGNNRLKATPVKVRLGQTTPVNVALRRGTVLSGRVTGPAGQGPDWGDITVVNAQTFDTMAHATTDADGNFTVHLLGPQDVKLLVVAELDRFPFTFWYRDEPDFQHARTIPIPPTGTKTLNISIPVP